MYERSAIVLERYLNKLFGFDKVSNLRENFYHFGELIEDLKEYQTMVTEEEKVINKFDEVAKEIQGIQKLQEKLSISNQKLEDERNKLFNALDENPNTIQSKMEKIEKIVEENNTELRRLGEEYIKTFVIFIERQKERNKFARSKRSTETKYITSMKEAKEKFKYVSNQDLQNMKRFMSGNKADLKSSIIEIMIKNGKSEKIGFNQEVITKAVETRMSIAEREAECYMACYERFKRLLVDIDNDTIKLERYEKFSKDNSAKLAFLNAEKEYIIDFLDNERMTVIGGPVAHKNMMEEACKNFDLDITQINNLYELILKEINGKSTKKAYNELYNKTYLRDIQAKERSFEAEATNIKVNLGTVINSNYWRIEGMKHIYEVFLQEVTEKFEKDLSDYKVDEIEIINEMQDISATKSNTAKEEKDNEMDNYVYTYNKEYDEIEDNYNNEDFEENNNNEDDYNDNEFNNYEDEYQDNDDNYSEEDYDNQDEYDESYEEDYQEDDEYDDENYGNDDQDDNYEDDYNDDEEDEDYNDDDYDNENEEDNYQEDEYDDDYDNSYEEDYDEDDEYDDENDNMNEYEENDDDYDNEINNPAYKNKYNNFKDNYNKYISNDGDDMEYDNIYASIISDSDNSYRSLRSSAKSRKKGTHAKKTKEINSRAQTEKRDKKSKNGSDENKGLFDMLFKKNDN